MTKPMLKNNGVILIKKTLTVILAGVFLFTNTLGWAKEERPFSTVIENKSFSSRPVDNNKLAPASRLNIDEFKTSLTVAAICKHVEHDGNLDDKSYLNDVLARLDPEKKSNIIILPYEIIIEIPNEGLAIRYFDPTKANVITPYSDISKLSTKVIGSRLNRQIIHRVKALPIDHSIEDKSINVNLANRDIKEYFAGYEDLSIRDVLIQAEMAFKNEEWKKAIELYAEACYGTTERVSMGLIRIAVEFNPELREMAKSYIRLAHDRVQICRDRLGIPSHKMPKGINLSKAMHISFEPIYLPNDEPIVFNGNVTNLNELRKILFVLMKQFHENFWSKIAPFIHMNEKQCMKGMKIQNINSYSDEAYFIRLFRLLLNDKTLNELLVKGLLSGQANSVFSIKNKSAKDLRELGYKEDWMVLSDILFYYFIYQRLNESINNDEQEIIKRIKQLVRGVKGYDDQSLRLDLARILHYQLEEAKIMPCRGPYEPAYYPFNRIYKDHDITDPLKIIFDHYKVYTGTSTATEKVRAVSLGHIFSILNGVFYGSGQKRLEEFFSKTTVGYDPQTAYANADEFYHYLCELDKNANPNAKVPGKFYIEEWGIGNGNFAKYFLDRLRALDVQHRTNYYNRMQYVLVDFSEPMLQGALNTLKEHKDRVVLEKCDLSRAIPQKREGVLYIRFNELYDDLPGIDIIEKKKGLYYKLYLEPVYFVSGESPDENAFIQIRKKDGTLLSLDEFVKSYLCNEKSSIDDIDFDSLRPHLGKIKFKQTLTEIDINAYSYGDFVKSFLKDRDEARVSINWSALDNLRNAVLLLDVQRGGYVQFYDYGFTSETYNYWLNERQDKSPLLEITPQRRIYDDKVYWKEQPTTLVNFSLFADYFNRAKNVAITQETQLEYLSRIHKKRFAPIGVLTPAKPIKTSLTSEEDEGVAMFLSSQETYVDYLPGFVGFKHKERISKILKQFSAEWNNKTDINTRKDIWLAFLSVLEKEIYKRQLPQRIREEIFYTEHTSKHSIFEVQNIKDAFDLSVRIFADEELHSLYSKKEKARAWWVTDDEIRGTEAISLFFTPEAVEKLIDILWKDTGEIHRFIHFKAKVSGINKETAAYLQPKASTISDLKLNMDNKNQSRYIDRNKTLFKDMLGKNKPDTLVRVPIEAIESVDVDNIRNFLATFQEASNGYIELYYMSGVGEVSETVYQKYGLQKKSLPKDFNRTRENTVTLFPALKGEEINQSAIVLRLGNVDISPQDTILSPIGLQHDHSGLIRATILGLKMMDVARQIKEKGIGITRDQAFKDKIQLEILEQLKNVCDVDDLKNFNLTPDDIIALATGTINNIISALKKLIKLLPITPIDANELRQIYEHVKAVITAA